VHPVTTFPGTGSSRVEECLRRNDAAATVTTVALLDTSAASTNLGDQIIMDAVRAELADLFRACMVFNVTSHEWMGPHSRSLIRRARWAIAGGTSLLSSRMWFRPSWRVNPFDALSGLKIVLMGAGWHQYQHKADPYSRWILRKLLKHNCLHSVRDNYTGTMLASIGITNFVNTACPTMWQLTPEHCRRIPTRQAAAVVTTVNSYKGLQNREADRRMLEILKRRYGKVYLWIQTHTDYEYARSLADGLTYINPNTAALNGILGSELDIDYVGNRLHAGIRALQYGRRTIIVAIDNRAQEMGQDFALPTVNRTDIERLEHLVSAPFETAVRLPNNEIARWKAQFQSTT
jgi:polysaccharide pyruvyl transferase WcaK-like protein